MKCHLIFFQRGDDITFVVVVVYGEISADQKAPAILDRSVCGNSIKGNPEIRE